jgi:hypothetical protein
MAVAARDEAGPAAREWADPVDLRDALADLNPVLGGRGNYLRTGNAARRFNQLDTYVWRRLRALRAQRKGRHLQPGEVQRWTRESFHELGLHRLRGTVACPEPVNRRLLERPPVSRVREIRAHGLQRGLARTPASRWKGK